MKSLLAYSIAALLLSNFVNCGPPLQLKRLVGFEDSDENRVIIQQEPQVRLPRNVIPIQYEIQLTPILAETEDFKQFDAPGEVKITVKCQESTSSITLHADDMEIDYDSIEVRFKAILESNECACSVSVVCTSYSCKLYVSANRYEKMI